MIHLPRRNRVDVPPTEAGRRLLDHFPDNHDWGEHDRIMRAAREMVVVLVPAIESEATLAERDRIRDALREVGPYVAADQRRRVPRWIPRDRLMVILTGPSAAVGSARNKL